MSAFEITRDGTVAQTVQLEHIAPHHRRGVKTVEHRFVAPTTGADDQQGRAGAVRHIAGQRFPYVQQQHVVLARLYRAENHEEWAIQIHVGWHGGEVGL